MIINKRKIVFEHEVFKDVIEGIEQGQGWVRRWISLTLAWFQDRNGFGTFLRRGKMSKFKNGFKNDGVKMSERLGKRVKDVIENVSRTRI